jgi:hypothetical protein
VVQLSKEEYELIKEAEVIPTFPKERWKTIVWWIIAGVGVICWGIYKLS